MYWVISSEQARGNRRVMLGHKWEGTYKYIINTTIQIVDSAADEVISQFKDSII